MTQSASSIAGGERVPARAAALAGTAERVLLIIADISGYTRYMTANAKTLSHSQIIITELVEAIVEEVQLPLEVAKLEGDAIFFFCRKGDSAGSWEESRRMISEKLLTFFAKFSSKVGELSQSVTCTCNACAHIEKLRLKLVVHSGEALFHRVVGFLELAGLDVIILHRLLKNSVQADEYLLLTESARQDLVFPDQAHFAQSSESYAEIGAIKTWVYFPGANGKSAEPVAKPDSVAGEPPAQTPERFTVRFARSWRLYRKLWFAPFTRTANPWRKDFHHLVNDTTSTGRIFFALVTLLLTPLVLPVGTLFILRHAASDPAAACNSHRHSGSRTCKTLH